MDHHCKVYPYSIGLLMDLLTEYSGASISEIREKLHCTYFKRYFSDKSIAAKTIVVEEEYTDRDYLEDFSAYYVRCFKNYNKVCTRLHFFSNKFSAHTFNKLLERSEKDLTNNDLDKAYLGFIVVKPLPMTIIGRTCLKTYDANGGRRFFPIKRKYDVNLYGINLQVNTIAFQEQDRVAAACATSALWSAFQRTGKLFNHTISSPVEITKSATKYSLPETRVFPNFGLSSEQMAQAIRDVGLEPFLINVKQIVDTFTLKSNLYAYLKSGIPAILGVDLIDTADPLNWISKDKHAIAVMGYSFIKSQIQPHGQSNFRIFASGLDKIYAHDDGVGPFARMEFGYKQCTKIDGQDIVDSSGNPISVWMNYLSTSWLGDDGSNTSVIAIPTILLIPLYHKIRIPFQTVKESVDSFNKILEYVRKFSGNAVIKDNVIWDIYLTTVNELKEDLHQNSKFRGEYLKELLLTPMPRFIWRADAYCQGEHIFDLLFDATDIELGMQFYTAITYEQDISDGLSLLILPKSILDDNDYKSGCKILEWFTTA